jgi:hypothetical protein
VVASRAARFGGSLVIVIVFSITTTTTTDNHTGLTITNNLLNRGYLNLWRNEAMKKKTMRSMTGIAGAVGMACGLLLLLFTAVPFATATANLTSLSPTNQLTNDYVENFDTDSYWISLDGGSLNSYGTKAYTNTAFSHITFYADVALRETAGTQDGFPRTRSGAYGWRLRNATGSFWRATISSGGVGEFSVWVRRWNDSPDPNYIVEYSIDNGNNWTFVQTINNAWLGSSDWKEVTGTINQTNGSACR